MSGSTCWKTWRETGRGGTTRALTAACKEMGRGRNGRIPDQKYIEIWEPSITDMKNRKKVRGLRKNNCILLMAAT
jgi:hypothetical protein